MNTISLTKSDPAMVQRFDWGELHWYAGSTRGNSTEVTVGECIIKPGHENPRHSHPNCSEILVVKKGIIAHTYGAREVVMNEEDTITVPPDIVHNARNIGETAAHLYIVFTAGDRQTQGE